MTDNLNINTNKGFFRKPYKYAEGFTIASILIIIGLILEIFIKGNGVVIPQMPYNVYIGLIFLTLIVYVQIFHKDKYIIKFLSSVPAAISAISSLTIIVLMMGLINQVDKEGSFLTKIGLTHLSESWIMIMLALYFLISLGLVTMRRAIPLNKKNFGFLLNHFGLWLLIFAAVIGNGDLKRLVMYTYEGEDATSLVSDELTSYNMPFSIKLIDFKVLEYNPKIVLINNSTGDIENEDKKGIIQVEEGVEVILSNWKIKVDTLFESAIKSDAKWISSDSIGAVQAIKFTATNSENNEIISGWIASGSFAQQYQIQMLDNKYSLAVLQPEPEKYSSDIEIFSLNGTKETTTIEVNKPYNYGGWKIYQISYDSDMGKWSNLSVLELVRDPWFPVVYVGMFMVLAGALYLFWIGKKTKDQPAEEENNSEIKK